MLDVGQVLPAAERPTLLEPSDHSLLRRLKSGNEDAATALYLRYAHRLLALAKAKSSPDLARLVAPEEIVQSVFGSFFRRAQTGYYDIPVGEELWKLFLVIALNKIRAKGAFHRAAKRDVRMTIQASPFDENFEVPPANDATALAIVRITAEESLAILPEQHRQIVILRIEGYEIEEIAQHIQRSKRTVERILQDARRRLAHLLDAD